MTKIGGMDIVNADLIVDDMKIGKVKGVIIDPQNWSLTHLEVEITKEAANQILGAKTAVRNRLAVTALKKGKGFRAHSRHRYDDRLCLSGHCRRSDEARRFRFYHKTLQCRPHKDCFQPRD